MQRRNFGKVRRGLVAVGVLLSACALFACGGDDDDDVRTFIATVPASNSTIAAVQGRPITITSGQVFGGNIGSGPITLTFTLVPNAFTVTTAAGVTTPGTVNYGSGGSCTFLPTTGGALAVSTCNLIVNASNVVVGTGQVSGTISLVLNNNAGVTVTSSALPATVFLDSDGNLFVVNPVTGVSVDMGIQP
jgi:hypothetical protein